MNKPKAKGTAAESAVVSYLGGHGFSGAERSALAGSNDRGDITGTPGLAWEVKAGVRLEIPTWLRETETERVNAGAEYGLLVIKPKGVGHANVGNWWAVQTLSQAVWLLRQAGFGDDLDRIAS